MYFSKKRLPPVARPCKKWKSQWYSSTTSRSSANGSARWTEWSMLFAVKAQVTGNLLTQNYAEGSFVRKGQLLFEIDPRPLQAAEDQAEGQLAQARAQLLQAQSGLLQARAQLTSAEANQHKAQLDEDRYIPLARAAGPSRARIWTTPGRTISRKKAQVARQRRLKWKARKPKSKASMAAVTAAAGGGGNRESKSGLH